MTTLCNSNNLTPVERFSLTEMTTDSINKLNNINRVWFLCKLTARVAGPIAVTGAALIDTISHIALAAFKLIVGLAVLPYTLIAKMAKLKKLPRDLSLSSACVHLIIAFESPGKTFFLGILVFINPKKAHEICNAGLGNQRNSQKNKVLTILPVPSASDIDDNTSSESEASEDSESSSSESSIDSTSESEASEESESSSSESEASEESESSSSESSIDSTSESEASEESESSASGSSNDSTSESEASEKSEERSSQDIQPEHAGNLLNQIRLAAGKVNFQNNKVSLFDSLGLSIDQKMSLQSRIYKIKLTVNKNQDYNDIVNRLNNLRLIKEVITEVRQFLYIQTGETFDYDPNVKIENITTTIKESKVLDILKTEIIQTIHTHLLDRIEIARNGIEKLVALKNFNSYLDWWLDQITDIEEIAKSNPSNQLQNMDNQVKQKASSAPIEGSGLVDDDEWDDDDDWIDGSTDQGFYSETTTNSEWKKEEPIIQPVINKIPKTPIEIALDDLSILNIDEIRGIIKIGQFKTWINNHKADVNENNVPIYEHLQLNDDTSVSSIKGLIDDYKLRINTDNADIASITKEEVYQTLTLFLHAFATSPEGKKYRYWA